MSSSYLDGKDVAPVSIPNVQSMKHKGQKIAMVTAYEYTAAKLVDATGIPLVLVGDSLGNVMLGYDSTIPVTMEDMLHHVKAVSRGIKRAMVIADLPFMTYSVNVEDALRNSARMLQEGGAHAVKLEGGVTVATTVRHVVASGIPVMGHIGLTPQSVHQLGGYRVQGKTESEATRLVRDALALEDAGAFSVVLEMVPAPLAKIITDRLKIPTIGIGSGPQCDGQVQVWHDFLGLFNDFVPKHTKRFADLSEIITQALRQYVTEVQDGDFPSDEHCFAMDEKILSDVQASI